MSKRLQDGSIVLDEEIAPGVWRRVTGTVSPAGKGQFRVALGQLEAKVSPVLPGAAAASTASKLSPTAPMPGLVRQILVKVGEKVQAGTPLVVMEAMKLQTTLTAGGDGVVEAIAVKEGQIVPEGAELVRVKA
jgi:biotin carboxyl carrier protein